MSSDATDVLLLDTGPLVATANVHDDDHERCTRFLGSVTGPLLMPAPVLTEVCYFLETRSGSSLCAEFLNDLADGLLEIVELRGPDLARMSALVRTYADLPLGAVDASVVAVAERLGVTEVATLDRRHFSIVRPAHTGAFAIVP